MTKMLGISDEEQRLHHDIDYLPRSLPVALDALENNEILMSALSPVIGQEFLKVKRLELDTYNLTVHPWERQMYMEAP